MDTHFHHMKIKKKLKCTVSKDPNNGYIRNTLKKKKKKVFLNAQCFCRTFQAYASPAKLKGVAFS